MILSVFKGKGQGSGNYVTLWVTTLDNYMHECRHVGDDWIRFRRAVEGKSEDKRNSLIRQFVEKNVAEPFILAYGSGERSASDIIPTASLDAFSEILATRLDPGTLQYV